jgi:hypothetical protein
MQSSTTADGGMSEDASLMLQRRRAELLAEIAAIQNDPFDDGTPGELDGAMVAVRMSELRKIDRLLESGAS